MFLWDTVIIRLRKVTALWLHNVRCWAQIYISWTKYFLKEGIDMFFSSMYRKCSKCGILCDDFAYDSETKTVLCFDCCEEEEAKENKKLNEEHVSN